MRVSAVLVGVAAFFVVASPVLAASQRDWDDCKALEPGRSIGGCNRIIQSQRETTNDRSVAYKFRGIAYHNKGDNDRAIADYGKAIRLDPKNAGAYSGRGMAYESKGDDDRAIADYSEAIRVDPKFAIAYNNRATLYDRKKDYDRAIADYSEAIRHHPDEAFEVFSYNNRAMAYNKKKDYDHAVADYSAVIRLRPKYTDAYFNRGRAYLFDGSLAKALADINQASELNPKDAYIALWLDIVGQRNNVPSRLSQAISQIDMTTWPGPVIRMFLGQMTPTAVLASANAQTCDVNFYNGELALRKGAKNEAALLFQLAASDCPHDSIEWDAANAELKALGVTP